MKFKELYNEGRNKWDPFLIKMNAKKWTFKNKETGQRYFIKISLDNPVGSLVNFLKSLDAKPPTLPKTQGIVDYMQFARDILDGKYGEVFVKSGKWNSIKSTWMLG